MYTEKQMNKDEENAQNLLAHENLEYLQCSNEIVEITEEQQQELTKILAKFDLLAHYITAKNIITIVEKHTGINIREQTRKREVTDARMIAMYLIKENTSLSYRQTACACGLQSHATAFHACNQVKNHMSFNHDFKNKYEDLINFTYKHKNMKTIANDLRTLLQNHYRVAAIEAEHIKNAAKAEEDLTEAIERLELTNKRIKTVQQTLTGCLKK